MADDDMMDAPKVQEILSTRFISMQEAHELLSRFLVKEHEDAVAEGGDVELLNRLDEVCASLVSTASNINTDNETQEKRAKKSAKKERKEKRKREKESSKKSKKSKDS